MTLSGLDERLLREDCTAKITLKSIPTLSPAQLAVAASREDLGVLIRQRAYHTFLSRRTAFLEGKEEASAANEIFSVAFGSTPSDVDQAPPTTLLLIPFDDQLRDEDLAQRAARRFRQLASEHQHRLKTEPPDPGDDRTQSQSSESGPVTMHIDHGFLECPSHDPLSADDLELQVDGGKLSIYQDGQFLGSVRASHIKRVSYIAGDDDGHDRVDYSLCIDARQVKLPDGQSLEPQCRLLLAFGMLDNTNPCFVRLRQAISRWQKQLGFRISIDSGDATDGSLTPAVADALSPTKPNRSSESVPPRSSPPERFALPTQSDGTSFSAFGPGVVASLISATGERSRVPSSPSPPASRALADDAEARSRTPSAPIPPTGPYRYLSRKRADVEWTAGFWARLYALLQAIGPRVAFIFPQFTREEIFILAFLSEPTSLPQLPKDPLPTTAKHEPVARLGLEHIYHRTAHLNVEQSRHVLCTSRYKDLQAYARIVGKIIDARDAFTDASEFLIKHEFKNRLGDRTNQDPVRSLIQLVQTLRDDPSSRLAYFAEPAEPGQSRPINSSRFSERMIGKGPSRRFDRELEDIVDYEWVILRDQEFWKRMPGA